MRVLQSWVMYRTLDPDKLLDTIHLFRRRIEEVFPGSGLAKVGGELEEAAKENFAELQRQKRPLWWLRSLVVLGVLGVLMLPAEALQHFHPAIRFNTVGELVQAADAGFNMILLLAGATLFLISAENRLKRRDALRALNQLRSLAHVVDMHQLGKDPSIVPTQPGDTEDSKTIQDAEQLWLYLSFCTNLLAVMGKLSASFADGQSDRAVLDTVNEIENLSTGLSQKIWQKMSFVKPPHTYFGVPPTSLVD